MHGFENLAITLISYIGGFDFTNLQQHSCAFLNADGWNELRFFSQNQHKTPALTYISLSMEFYLGFKNQ